MRGRPAVNRAPRAGAASPETTQANADAEHWLKAFIVSRDETLRERLILHHAPLVRALASRFTARGVPIEDLIQVGSIGLINALDRYDPTHGAKFGTYAVPTIVGEIKRYFRDHNWQMKAPRRLRELNLSLIALREEILRQTGNTPTVAELAERLGVDEEQALAGLEVSVAYRAESLGDGLGETAEGAPRWQERLGQTDSDLELVELRQVIEKALATLPPRLRALIELRFFADQSQADVARLLGISQMQVSRLEQQARAHLHPLLRAFYE